MNEPPTPKALAEQLAGTPGEPMTTIIPSWLGVTVIFPSREVPVACLGIQFVEVGGTAAVLAIPEDHIDRMIGLMRKAQGTLARRRS